MVKTNSSAGEPLCSMKESIYLNIGTVGFLTFLDWGNRFWIRFTAFTLRASTYAPSSVNELPTRLSFASPGGFQVCGLTFRFWIRGRHWQVHQCNTKLLKISPNTDNYHNRQLGFNNYNQLYLYSTFHTQNAAQSAFTEQSYGTEHKLWVM